MENGCPVADNVVRCISSVQCVVFLYTVKPIHIIHTCVYLVHNVTDVANSVPCITMSCRHVVTEFIDFYGFYSIFVGFVLVLEDEGGA